MRPIRAIAVGAAILGRGGQVFAACNVENAAYPQGQCAEANAIGMMVAAGERAIAEFALVGSGDLLCTPCGGCRQRLAEFGRPETTVLPGGTGGPAGDDDAGRPAAHGVRADQPRWRRTSGRRGCRRGDPDAARAACSPWSRSSWAPGSVRSAERVAEPVTVAYDELPGFPRPSVQGHAGRLVLGRLGGVPVACLSGRAHLYEGVGPRPLNTLVRTLKAIGCRAILLTNASGSLRPELGPGSLVLIEDHINLQGTNPLVGPNDEAVGPRFVDLTEVYAARLRSAIGSAAAARGIALGRGVYLAVLGPSFETPAEIRAYRALGADLVGMSTVPEAISARHAGLEVAAISVVTNLAAGLAGEPLTHADTLSQSAAAVGRVGDLLEAALPEIARVLA